ncbi:site-specific tyrosine recombinase XerD [Georgenia sp. Z1491]|uniref:site-specific tyrosine recombinase XerD n=1 Tax=Georgenia sp. Z1491 TaxID=3416707 RepID=UPI003CEFEF51
MSPDGLAAALEQYLAHVAVERGLSAHTVAAYRRDLTRYAQHLRTLGRRDLASVTVDDVAGFAATLAEGSDGGRPLAASSAARAVTAARGWHRFALAEGLVPDDVAARVRPPAQGRRLPKAVPVADVEALIAAAGAAEEPLGVRDAALVEVLYGTGARISEAVGLVIDDVDLAERAVRLFGKGRKERVVPLGGPAADAVGAYLVRGRPALAARGRGNASLFLNTLGRPLSRQSAWGVLRAAGERAGIEVDHLSPHTLRHSFATHLLAGGADVRVVQELLGHASVTTTQIYTQVTVQALREVYATSHPRARHGGRAGTRDVK